MSKKAARRARRDAFPKTPARGARPTGAKSTATRSTGSRSAAARKGNARARALKQPSWKRAAIQGGVLAVLYFVVIQYLWKSSTKPNVWGSLIIAAIGFVAYTCIAYFVDRFNYNRKLRKLKGPEK